MYLPDRACFSACGNSSNSSGDELARTLWFRNVAFDLPASKLKEQCMQYGEVGQSIILLNT